MTYVAALLWGFALLASFYGYGVLVGRALGRRFVDGGLAVAWGMSLLIVGGGVLNLVGVISNALIVSLVAAGAVGWLVFDGPRRLLRAARRLRPPDYLAVAVLLTGYLNWLCFNARAGLDYNIYVSDDSSYTLFPEMMLQTGSMGIDPFNDRLTMTGLGGIPFLQTLILAVLPMEYIHLADPGLAYLAIGVILFSGWPARLTAPARAMLAMLFASIPTSSNNASAVAMPVVLMLAIVRELEHNRSGGTIRSGAGVALLLAALLTLKTTFIPAGISLVFFRGVFLTLISRRIRPLLEGAVTAICLFAMLMPWTVFSSYSSGSLWYPVLGEGFRKHSLNLMPHQTMTSRAAEMGLARLLRSPQTQVMLIGIAAAVGSLLLRKTYRPFRAAQLAGLGSCLLCLIVFMATFGDGTQFWRYYYAIEAFSLLSAYSVLVKLVPTEGRWRCARIVIYAILAGHILFYGPKAIQKSRNLPKVIAAALRGRTKFTSEEIDCYRRNQYSVPVAAPIFSILTWPVLFDLRRNKIYYHDSYGNVSPPPGIPMIAAPESLGDYLRFAGLRYIACPCRDTLRSLISDRTRKVHSMEGREDVSEWFLVRERGKINFLENILILSRRYSLLFDDCQIMMIDLGSPAPLAEASMRRSWPCHRVLGSASDHPRVVIDRQRAWTCRMTSTECGDRSYRSLHYVAARPGDRA